MSDLPRLLVLASTYPRWRGDPEPGFVHELTKRLLADFRVTVLTPHAPGALTRENLDGVDVVRYRYAPESWETLVNAGGIVANLKRDPAKYLLLPAFFLAQAWVAWRLMRKLRPAVVHAHWLIPQGLVVAMLGSFSRVVPAWVVTSHGADLYALRSAPMQALKRFVVTRAAALAVVSSPMRAELECLGGDGAAIAVQPMGVDLGRFCPDPAIVRDAEHLLFVGRLVAKKGVRHLVEAIPEIARSRPGIRLSIVGFGPELASLRKLASQLGVDGRVDFVGAVEQRELPALYRRASVFVAPFVRDETGDQEGLGLVMVEAAGCGCAIVAGKVPAVSDVMSSPVLGAVVDPRASGALAQAILAQLAKPVSPDEEARRAAAVAHFDWEQRAKAYAALLRKVAGLGPA